MADAQRTGPRLLGGLGTLAVVGLVVVVLAGLLVGLAARLPDLSDLAGPPEQCSEIDPTASAADPEACLTPTAAALHDATVARFGRPGDDGPLRASRCWSEHAWNPSSDHPHGRACDFFPTGYGRFAAGDELRDGWEVARWLSTNASELGVRYVIWQGRIWTAGRGDGSGAGSWGRPYDGGGVYDPDDATGGHFDHIHVSVRR